MAVEEEKGLKATLLNDQKGVAQAERQQQAKDISQTI
jgi:hypothetical protein